MGKEPILSCPHCSSHRIVRNGHHYGGKLQYLCTSCHKHFSKDAIKGYPSTKIPFPVIAYLLYLRRKVPALSNMREYRKLVNHWLSHLRITDKKVSRQTIHHWINNFEKHLDKVITFQEASNYCKTIIKAEEVPEKIISHERALKLLERKFGKEFCFHLIRNEPEFFNELCEIISKHQVFCWEVFDKNYSERSVSQRSPTAG